MSIMNVTSFDAGMRDLYPRPGERIKKWVVDQRREDKWASETCPRIPMDPHLCNAGFECSGSAGRPWCDLPYHECDTCLAVHENTRTSPDVAAWLGLQAARPPICADRSLLSDEIQPDLSLRENPILAFLEGRK